MKGQKTLLALVLFAVLIQFCCLSTGQGTQVASDTVDWSMFRRDLNHSSYTAGTNTTNSSKLLWNYTTGLSVFSSPAVVDGCVFVGSADGHIYCLNSSTGGEIWFFPTGGQVRSSPAVCDGRLVVGSDDGWVYCLNSSTGLPLWISMLGGYVRSSPAIVGDRVYIGSGDQDLYCLSIHDGTTVWTYKIGYRVDSSPAVADGVVYFAADDFFVYAVNASTGDKIWATRTASTKSSPCLGNGCVYIGSYDGYVCALNASTGRKIWQYQTLDEVDSSPVVAYGRVYVGSDDNSLYCINASNGQKLWQNSTGYWVRSSPTVAGGNVYVGSEDNSIYSFDAYTGTKQWIFETKNMVDSSPTIYNNTLYIGSLDNQIYAFTLYNSTNTTLPLTANAPIKWSTVAFDATVCAIAVGVVVATVLMFRQEKREKQKLAADTLEKKPPWYKAHLEALCVAVILVFAAALFLVNLGVQPLWAADEQTYSQWAFHMVRTGDYLTPWCAGFFGIWIAKPPFLMWLMSLSYQAFGITNFAARIWTPLFGALSLVTVFYLGKKLYNMAVGFASAVILGTFVLFFMFSRAAMTDVPLVCFMLASIYFLLLSDNPGHSTRYAVLSGLMFGLALMTKQFVALLVPAIIIVYWATTKRSLRFIVSKRFALFLGFGALLFVPWAVAMYASFGSQFMEWYFGYTGFERTFSALEGHLGGPLFYFNFLATKENLLWVALLPFAVGLCIYKAVKRSKPDLLIVLWIVIVLGVFTVAQTKIYWYILPAYPAFAIAIAAMLYAVWKKYNLERYFKLPQES